MLNYLSFRRVRLLSSAFAIASVCCTQTLPGLAQGDDGSMDDIWSDQAGSMPPKAPAQGSRAPVKAPVSAPQAVIQQAPQTAPQARKVVPQAAPAVKRASVNAQTAPVRTQTAPPPAAQMAPSDAPAGQFAVCKLSELTKSTFIKSGAWPGIGPFQPDDKNHGEYCDQSNNRMKVNLAGDNVTQLQLSVASEKNHFLSLEMATDFLLEALGENSSKIARFNQALEEKQADIQVNRVPVKLSAGRLDVSIQNVAPEQATNSNFVILVEGNGPSNATKPRQIAMTQGAPVVNTNPADQNKFTLQPPPQVNDPPQVNPAQTVTTTQTPVGTSPAPAEVTSNEEMLKQFTRLIQNWQDIKRVVVKSRRGDSLSKILGGNALATQNQAIKWLLDNQKFYEMVPLGLEVAGYETVVPDKTYTVNAHIRERRKIVDANTMNVLKDSVQSYNVAYTVEKVTGGWLIVDSKMMDN